MVRWSPIIGAVSDLAESRARCACPAAVSIAQNLPLVLVVSRRNDVSENFEGALHRSNPGCTVFYGRRRYDFRHWLAKPGDADRFLRRTDPFEHGETLGFEFRDGDFLHNFSLWS